MGSLQHGQDVFKGWEKVLKQLHVEATRETQSVFVYLSSELHAPLAHPKRPAGTLPSLWLLHQSNCSQQVAVCLYLPSSAIKPSPTLLYIIQQRKGFFSTVTLQGDF